MFLLYHRGMNYLPAKLVKLRKHYNFSQNHLAKVLDIDVLEYMGYENGRCVPGYNQIRKLASFYHISFTELFRNDENATLFNVRKGSTDEVNISYFLKEKSLFAKAVDKIRDYAKIHPYRWYGFLFLLLCVFVSFFVLLKVGSETLPYTPTINDTYRLDVSDTTVVYIDNAGAIRGSGDNANGQISNLSTSPAIKVEEGSNFTIALMADGTLQSYGLLGKYAKELDGLSNIVDIAAGNGHVVAVDNKGRPYAVGDNSFGQCDVSSFSDIIRVYATNTGSILIRRDGKAQYCGSFMGSSMLKNHDYIKGLDSSENILALIENDNKVYYYAKSKVFNAVSSWKDIVDVACGDDFIAALDKSGKVYIDVESEVIRNKVAGWENIIAIAAGNDYLVAFDGVDIYGVGKNSYHQYPVTEDVKAVLPTVSNVKVTVDGKYLSIQFDKVENASEYLVSIDAGIGYTSRSVANIIKFDLSNLEDGKSYRIEITAIGEGDYEDSNPYAFDYIYHQAEEDNSSDNAPTVIETPFTIDMLIGKTKTNFEAYLLGLGVDKDRMTGIEVEEECNGDEAVILEVEGIAEFEKITSSELKEREISYKYCKVE